MMMLVPSEHLGGAAEVADLLDCPRQQLHALRKRDDFPQPVIMLAATPIWDLRLVEAFKKTWKRRGPRA